MLAKHSLGELVKEHIVELGRGQIISGIDLEACPGSYPVYSSSAQGDGLFGKYGKFMFDEELITWSIDGGGRFFFRDRHKYSITNVSGFLRIRNRNVIHPKFLFYQLTALHSRFNFDYQLKAHPSVIAELYKIAIPPLSEQKRIAEILDEVDRQIEAHILSLTKTRSFLKTFEVDLLTTPKTHSNWHEELQYSFPKAWRAEKVAAVCEQVTVGIVIEPSKLYHPDGTIPLIRSFNIQPFEVLNLELQYMREADRSKVKKSEIKSQNDVLVVRTGNPGTAAVAPEWMIGGNCVDLLLARVNPNLITAEYLALWINSPFGKDHVFKKQGGLAQQHFNTGELQQMPIILPSLAEQKMITDRHNEFLLQIKLTQKAIEKTQKLKAGLISKLIGGIGA